MTKRIDLTGQDFGHLVVIVPAETRGAWYDQREAERKGKS